MTPHCAQRRATPFQRALTPLAALALAGVAFLAASPRSHAADGPRGNLLVSWRVSGGGDARRDAQGLRTGQVVVDSRRGVSVSGRAGVEWSSQQATVDQRVEQQVMVLNGGKARLDLRQQRPVTQWQWAASFGGSGHGPGNSEPQVGLISETVWVDSGHGLAVRPRWAGGRAPVVVELEAEAPVPSSAAHLSRRFEARDAVTDEPARLIAQTTVTVPMGQWVAVASTRQQASRQQSGTVSTADIDQDDRAVLEIKVSLP
ncbi:MAG: hypothetical protein EOP40_07885 [Rubrivivax sp.]|nr:MAG: hypothetical protein EOP40_07885 [Rubrivivax sp.]